MKFAISIISMVMGILFLYLLKKPGGFDFFAGQAPGVSRAFVVSPGLKIAFRWVPEGTVGPSVDSFGGQTPKTVVGRGFWMSETEITNEQWAKVMESGAVENLPDHPVHSVSWDDCMDFLSRLESPGRGWVYSLPTEVEWEYACRAGSTAPFHGIPERVGWLEDNSGGRSHRVGLLEPNAYGLHDMHGNVAEWCLDTTDEKGRERAIRGGSWDSNFNAEASSRNSDVRGLRINRVGFRIVLRYQR